jgi:hypothetical protein
MNIEFEQISNDLYRIVDPSDLIIFVDTKLEEISLGLVESFETILNNDFKDKIASRVIAAAFSKQYPKIFNDSVMFITIKTTYNERELVVTSGALPMDDNIKLLSGVMYK